MPILLVLSGKNARRDPVVKSMTLIPINIIIVNCLEITLLNLGAFYHNFITNHACARTFKSKAVFSLVQRELLNQQLQIQIARLQHSHAQEKQHTFLVSAVGQHADSG